MKDKVCIIGVYMGKFPDYINLWLLSVKNNPTIDFLVVTDSAFEGELPPNLKILSFDLAQFKSLAAKKMDMHIRCETPYKICDYKPLYGLIFEDYIKEYDYWGECDFDVIFGDLRCFFDKYELNKYDKFMNRGHLTLYKNDKKVIERFRLKGGAFGSYKEIFRSDMVWGLDEMFGINRIYKKYGFPCFDDFIIADIDMRYRDLRLVHRQETHLQNYEKQVFYWSHGKIFRDFINEKGLIETQEFAYIHLAKRKYNKPTISDTVSKFYITPKGFISAEEIKNDTSAFDLNEKDNTNTVLRKHKTSKFDKKMKFFWIGRRYLNLKYKLQNRHKK